MIVWLASYPRSGNTMLRMLLRSVFDLKSFSKHDDTKDIGADDRLIERVGHRFLNRPWSQAYPEMATSSELNLVKTHDPPEDSAKAIYIARDGRSACRSYFHYMRDFGHAGDEYSLCDVVAGMTPTGSWGDHLDAWNPLNRADTLFLKYEDLLVNPDKEIRRIAGFLNRSPIREWRNDFAGIKKIDPRFFRAGTANDPNTALNGKEKDIFHAANSDWMEKLNFCAPCQPVSPDAWHTYRQFISTKGKQHFQLFNRLNDKAQELNQAYSRISARESEIADLETKIVQKDASGSESLKKLQLRMEELQKQIKSAQQEQARLSQQSTVLNENAETARQKFSASLAVKDEAIQSLAAVTRELDTRLRMLLTSRFMRFGWRLGFGSVPYWDNPSKDELTGMVDAVVRKSIGSTISPPSKTSEMDRALRHLLSKGFQPTMVLDIGAAKGCWSRLAATYWPKAKFFMIDPLRESEPSLRQMCRADRFEYLLTAVGDQSGERIINLTTDYDGSSLLNPPDADPARQRTVSVTTIDELLTSGQIQPPQLVQIDVQGFELQVMDGGEQMFRSTEVFILEVNLYRFWNDCPRVDEMIRYMADRQYFLFDLAGLLRRPFENDLGQMDLVFVRADSHLLASARWF